MPYIERHFDIDSATLCLASVIRKAKKERLKRLNLVSSGIVGPILIELTSISRVIQSNRAVPSIESNIFRLALEEQRAKESLPLILNRVDSFWLDVRLGQVERPSSFLGVVRMMKRLIEDTFAKVAGRAFDNKVVRLLLWIAAFGNAVYFQLSYGKYKKSRSNAITGVDLSGKNYAGADLKNADLSAVELRGAKLSGANLSGANLTIANLTNADLSMACLSHADVSGASLCGANCAHADLRNVSLVNANLSEANLTYANISCADLCGANLFGANLNGANLCGSDLRMANLESASLKDIKWNTSTFWPDKDSISNANDIPEALLSPSSTSGVPAILSYSDACKNLSDDAKRTLFFASEECIRMRHEAIGTDHILIGIIIEGRSYCARTLRSRGVGIKQARGAVSSLYGKGRHTSNSLQLTPKACEVLAIAHELSRAHDISVVECDVLVLALNKCDCAGRSVLTTILGHAKLAFKELGDSNSVYSLWL